MPRLMPATAALLVLFLGAQPLFAGPVSVTDVQVTIASSPVMLPAPATAADGPFPGNDKNDTGQGPGLLTRLTMLGLFSAYISDPSDWQLVGSSDGAGGGPFTGHNSNPTGNLDFDGPIDGPFIIALKAGNDYTAYFFNSNFKDVLQLLYNTQALDKKDLSHASLYRPRTTDGTDGAQDNDADGTVIPEPISLVLWGALGLGVVVSGARRRSKANRGEGA